MDGDGDYDLPTRDEVLAQIRALREGRISREEADAWATAFIVADGPYHNPRIVDWGVWRAIQKLSGCDLRHGKEEPYLFDDESFAEWERQLMFSDTAFH